TLPGALFVVDALREIIALREARKLKIPTVALIDTDSDPDMVDIPIPGNDDGVRAIEIIVEEICNAIELGKMSRSDKAEPAQPATTAPRIASSSPQAPKDEEGFKNEPSQPAPGDQSTPQPTTSQMDKQPDAAVSIGAQNDQDIATENHKSRDESIGNLPDQQEDKQQDEQRE
ncbi:MAG: 30S ribosomal protein S2, partial [Planctomycetes bacterium]|nr:30S ribosomal protein S2 [Planctomycetota bacterium]